MALAATVRHDFLPCAVYGVSTGNLCSTAVWSHLEPPAGPVLYVKIMYNFHGGTLPDSNGSHQPWNARRPLVVLARAPSWDPSQLEAARIVQASDLPASSKQRRP
jgi:hypothetical protein